MPERREDCADHHHRDSQIDEPVLEALMHEGLEEDCPEGVGGGDALLQRRRDQVECDVRKPEVARHEDNDQEQVKCHLPLWHFPLVAEKEEEDEQQHAGDDT